MARYGNVFQIADILFGSEYGFDCGKVFGAHGAAAALFCLFAFLAFGSFSLVQFFEFIFLCVGEVFVFWADAVNPEIVMAATAIAIINFFIVCCC